jgi:D-alanyl-D-alanine carboxypeptidase
MVTATAEAYHSEPSWVGLKAGEKMSVRDLCRALMVESANDAAIVLGVNSAGTLKAFVGRMNARAAELGMCSTKYHNPNGLPPNAKKRYPWKQFNVSTASDQLKLALALLGHPETLEFTSIKTCDLVKTPWGFRTSVTRRVNEPTKPTALANGETVVKSMCNHNNVMCKDKLKMRGDDGKETVDGLKTGYIDAGGSSVVLTGTRGGKRAVVVVLGSASAKERDENARRLMDDALGALDW